MSPEELRSELGALKADLATLKNELILLRQDIAPILRWKTGIASLFAIILAIGVVARAVDYIVQLLHDQIR